MLNYTNVFNAFQACQDDIYQTVSKTAESAKSKAETVVREAEDQMLEIYCEVKREFNDALNKVKYTIDQAQHAFLADDSGEQQFLDLMDNGLLPSNLPEGFTEIRREHPPVMTRELYNEIVTQGKPVPPEFILSPDFFSMLEKEKHEEEDTEKEQTHYYPPLRSSDGPPKIQHRNGCFICSFPLYVKSGIIKSNDDMCPTVHLMEHARHLTDQYLSRMEHPKIADHLSKWDGASEGTKYVGKLLCGDPYPTPPDSPEEEKCDPPKEMSHTVFDPVMKEKESSSEDEDLGPDFRRRQQGFLHYQESARIIAPDFQAMNLRLKKKEKLKLKKKDEQPPLPADDPIDDPKPPTPPTPSPEAVPANMSNPTVPPVPDKAKFDELVKDLDDTDADNADQFHRAITKAGAHCFLGKDCQDCINNHDDHVQQARDKLSEGEMEMLVMDPPDDPEYMAQDQSPEKKKKTSPLNTTEPLTRKPLDSYKLVGVKKRYNPRYKNEPQDKYAVPLPNPTNEYWFQFNEKSPRIWRAWGNPDKVHNDKSSIGIRIWCNNFKPDHLNENWTYEIVEDVFKPDPASEVNE